MLPGTVSRTTAFAPHLGKASHVCGIRDENATRDYVWQIIVRVSPTSAPAWDQTVAAPVRSKRLNHYPVVAAYFMHVRRAGSSTGLPPSIEVAEQRCVNMLVSE